MKKAFTIVLLLLLLTPPLLYLSSSKLSGWVDKKVFATWSREQSQTDLKSFLNKISGVQRLQVAEMEQFEKITRQSRRKVFWEKLELPVVVVSIELPVRYTYYVDLDKKWSAVKDEQGVWSIIVPDLEFNPPAGDISAMNIVVEKSSVFRNEEAIKNQLMSEMTGFLKSRAKDHKALVIEQARKEILSMVQKWLIHKSDPSEKIQILFQSEAQPESDPGSSI